MIGTLVIAAMLSLLPDEWSEVKMTPQNAVNWPPAESGDAGIWFSRRDSIVHDKERHVLVLFKEDGTYEWNGTNWNRVSTTGPAQYYLSYGTGYDNHYRFDELTYPRWSTTLVYDPSRKRTVLFGGATYRDGSGYPFTVADTWFWNGKRWMWNHKIQPDVNTLQSFVRSVGAMAADPKSGNILCFGGYNDSFGSLADLLWFDGKSWSRISTEYGPEARYIAAMAYDPRRKVFVLYGGYIHKTGNGRLYGDTWEWDGAAWNNVTPKSGKGPGKRAAHTLVYVPAAGGVVLFGGIDGMYYDRSDGFYGLRGNATNDAWIWDGRKWKEIAVSGAAPPIRYGHGAAYDSLRKTMVIYGGEDDEVDHNDLWYLRIEKRK